MPQPFKLRYTPEALESISGLSPDLKKIAERVFLHLAEQPQSGKRLAGKFKGLYSERVTRRYRILYLIKHAEREIIILDLKHRREAYE